MQGELYNGTLTAGLWLMWANEAGAYTRPFFSST
jgi:hypothetical protein